MKKILYRNFALLKNPEHIELMSSLCPVIGTHPMVSEFQETFSEFHELVEKEKKAMQVTPGSKFTPAITQHDDTRDAYFRALKQHVKADLLLPKHTDEYQSALQLQRVIKAAGDVVRKNQEAKTGEIHTLLGRVRAEAISPILTAETQKKLKKLALSNYDFEADWQKRKIERAEKVSGEVKAAREKVDEVFRLLMEEINVMARTKKELNGELLIAKINSIMQEYHMLLKGRRTRKKNKAASGGGKTLLENGETLQGDTAKESTVEV